MTSLILNEQYFFQKIDGYNFCGLPHAYKRIALFDLFKIVIGIIAVRNFNFNQI